MAILCFKTRFMPAIALTALTMVLACACSSKNGHDEKHQVKYLAVQKDKDSHWSIIDDNGNVIVKEEYEPECIISQITDDGMYWVISNGKMLLYSIDSPKRPVSPREFDAAQPFYSGHAFAIENAGDQIELIDNKCETVKTLPKNIAKVCPFQEGMAQYKDANGKWGYLNTDGEVKIEAKYYKTNDFSEGYAIVQKEEDGDYIVITADGKEKTTIKRDKYLALSEFHGGVVCSEKNNDSKELIFLDADGKEAVILSKKISGYSDGYRNGRAIISDFENGFKTGIVDRKGEFAVRIGKYGNIHYINDGYYVVGKDDKYGIVDGNDNEIVDFRYDGALTVMLGDNFIMSDGDEYILVSKDGEEIRGNEFHAVSMLQYTIPLNYYDIDGLAKKIADNYSSEGYLPLKGADSSEAIAKLFGLSMEECKWKEYFTQTSDSGELSVSTKIYLDRFPVKTKYRTETVNDGWFEYQRQIEDGLMWNDEAHITHIMTCVTLTDESMAATFAKTIIPMLKQQGFVNQLNDRCFSDSENKANIVVEESGSEVNIILKYS